MSFSLPSWWPLKKAAPPVDVEAVARQAGQQAATAAIAELQRQALSLAPVNPIPDPKVKPPFPLYAFDNPLWYATPQSPKRRPGVSVTTDTLRRLADSYDILRACIIHLQREVSAVPVEIVAKDSEYKRGTDSSLDTAIDEAEAFFAMDGGLGGVGRRRSHFEAEVIEDLCVIGAAATYYSPTRGAVAGLGPGVYEVLPIDASTIRPRVDAYGWPGPGQAAFEQWVYGVQVRSFTREELRYDGVYPVSNSPYFRSPVEWLLGTINAALRTDQWNLAWLTDGTTPADTVALPEGWTPDQITAFAQFDAAMRAGDSKQRQKTRWLPHGSVSQGANGRKDQDFSEFELWLLRRTCGIMGVMPASIGFVGEQYKVSQENSMEHTSAFGVGVLLEFRKALYDDLLARMGYGELETRNVLSRDEDPKERAERNSKLVESGIKLLNEARADEGLDPIQGGDVPLVPNTLVTLESVLAPPPPPPTVAPATDAPDDTDAAETAADDAPEADQQEDLGRWERKALNRLQRGKSAACEFESAVIPTDRALNIRAALLGCETPLQVRDTFEKFACP